MMKSAGLILLGLVAACAGPPAPNAVECYLIRKVCYRGNHVDRLATRERFGVEGIIAIEQSRSR
jgi:hypothetical protein